MNTTINYPPVKKKYVTAAKKLIEGDAFHAANYEFTILTIHHLAETLLKKKKLTAQEKELLANMYVVLPPLIQLKEQCVDWFDNNLYTTKMRALIIAEQKRAQKGNKEAIKKYNSYVRDWGKYEPGRFMPIKV